MHTQNRELAKAGSRWPITQKQKQYHYSPTSVVCILASYSRVVVILLCIE